MRETVVMFRQIVIRPGPSAQRPIKIDVLQDVKNFVGELDYKVPIELREEFFHNLKRNLPWCPASARFLQVCRRIDIRIPDMFPEYHQDLIRTLMEVFRPHQIFTDIVKYLETRLE